MELTLSASLLALTHCSREPSASSQLTSHLLVDQEDDRGVCHEFLTEMISRFPEDESAEEAMAIAMQDLGRGLASKSMNDDYKPYVLVGRNVPIVQIMSNTPSGFTNSCTVPCTS